MRFKDDLIVISYSMHICISVSLSLSLFLFNTIHKFRQIPILKYSRLCGQNLLNTSKYIQIHLDTMGLIACVYIRACLQTNTCICVSRRLRKTLGAPLSQGIGLGGCSWRDPISHILSRWMQKCNQFEWWSSPKAPYTLNKTCQYRPLLNLNVHVFCFTSPFCCVDIHLAHIDFWISSCFISHIV